MLPVWAIREDMMGQDIFDLILVLVLVYFTMRGFWHGFVGEVAGLVSLIGGFWAANSFHAALSPYLTFIVDPGWRTIAAYVLIFLAVILAVAIVARILQKILSLAFVSWADRLAGGVLGLAKGILLCSLVLILLQKIFYNAPFLQHSRVLPYFNTLITHIRSWLPPELASHLTF
ncbi:MAG: CvpA family protein [Desulfovibrionaceae bacterium]|nr:CvpA family protein [Desulfovibrionaceae bacterium]